MQGDDGQRGLKDHITVLRRHRWLVVLVTLGLVAVALVVSALQTPVYRARAEVLIRPVNADAVFESAPNIQASFATVETEIRVLESDPVRTAVRDELGVAAAISATRVGETEVMQVEALDESATRASRIANAYAHAYVNYRKDQAVGHLRAAAIEVQNRLDQLETDISELDRRIVQASPSDRPVIESSLRPRYNNLVTQQGELEQKLDALQVDAALRRGGAEVVRAAETPTSPIKPAPVRNGAAALFFGAMLGTGLAYLKEHFDDSVNTKEELSRAADGLPVLGMVPKIPARSTDRPGPSFDWLLQTSSPAAEAYKGLRTSVQLLGIDRPIRTVQVTSPMPGEGKSTIAASLAMVLAAAGQRVVLVDCDLRRPMVHQVFELPGERGLTAVLAGDVALPDALWRVAPDKNLFALPCGAAPPNPSELLSSRRTAELIFELQSRFDTVVIDSPPLLPVTDATVLAGWVESVILVARAGQTTGRQITDALDRLKQVEADVAGA